MKPSQKLTVFVENLKFVQRFDELDKALLHVAAKLEKDGDEFGPVADIVFAPNEMCVRMAYADKRRSGKPELFGENSDKFLARQYK